ncbi:MAG: hypothetical protein ACI9I8_002162, partial [Cellvibrionaceae bacterium]
AENQPENYSRSTRTSATAQFDGFLIALGLDLISRDNIVLYFVLTNPKVLIEA